MDDLDWSPHINSIVTKANGCQGLIKRIIRNSTQELRELVYLSQMRSQLEYACVARGLIWNKRYIKSWKSTKEGSNILSNKITQNITVQQKWYMNFAGKTYKIEEKTHDKPYYTK